MIKNIIIFIYLLIFHYFLFGLTAKYYGKKCQYNCENCKNWACTHGTDNKSCYPVRDWSKWCFKKGYKN